MSLSDISNCKVSPAPLMQLEDFRILRFQFRRDRVIGDSQVRAEEVHVATLELVDETGRKRTWLRPVAVHAASRPASRSSGCFARRSGPTSRRRSLSLWCMGSRGFAAATSASRRCRFARQSRSLSGISRRSRRGCRCSACLAQGATGSRPTRPVWTSTSMTTPSANSSAMPTRSATAPSRSRWGTRISSATSTGSIFCARPSARTRRSWSTPTRRGAPRKLR